MSKVIDFFRCEGVDEDGRRLPEILAWDDTDWEYCHDHIQWVFPLTEPSRFNPDAPLLTAEDITLFKSDPALQERLRDCFHRFLRFTGLKLEDGQVVPGANWGRRRCVWQGFNHNFLRTTRVLSCLKTLGLEAEADAFFVYLKKMYDDGIGIDTDSLQYWVEAVKGLKFHH